MAKLKAAQRKKLKKSQFAEPAAKKYPIEDRAHARNALSRVSANGTPAEKKEVRAAVAKDYPAMGKLSDAEFAKAKQRAFKRKG